MQERTPLCLIIIDGCNNEELQAHIECHPTGLIGRLCNNHKELVIASEKQFRNENCWDLLLTGNTRPSTGSRFDASDYSFTMESLEHRTKSATFYEDLIGSGKRVVSLDIPGPIIWHANSIQVSGWGNETSSATPMSNPSWLVDEILSRFGDDPKQEGSSIEVKNPRGIKLARSYQVPDIYNQVSIDEFSIRLSESVRRRSSIIEWLANSTYWDLFVGVYTELHTANHVLWHLKNPLPGLSINGGKGKTEDLLSLLDEHLASIRANIKAECKMAVITIDDLTSNSMDVPSMALLPELLYRWCNSGEALLEKYDFKDEVSHWKSKIWSCATKIGKQKLESPIELTELKEPLSWNPAYWYRSLWPYMKAFALPSVADGYIRLNIKGRESRGLVSQECFAETVDTLLRLIGGCKNEHGQPVAKDILVTRQDAHENPEIDPDIIVVWNPETITQRFTCDNLNGMSLGPFPFFRSGGHRGHGSIIENRIFLESGLHEILFRRDHAGPATELHDLSALIKRYYQPEDV